MRHHFCLAVCTLLLMAPARTPAFAQTTTAPPTLRGAHVLITGSTDGLGRDLARAIAAQGAHVIVHGRNRARGDSLVAEIGKSGVGSARFYAADFASLATVAAFADTLLAHYPTLDVLINNAGIALNRSLPRQLSDDGYELHFAVNYLAGYVLTERLRHRLRASAAPRIINVASRTQEPLVMTDIMLTRGYSGGRGYAQSKLAQVMYTFDLAAEEQARTSGAASGAASGGDTHTRAITVYAVHPASQMDTELVRGLGGRPRSSVDEGVQAVLHALTSNAPSGTYFVGEVVGRANAQAYDALARARLRTLTRSLTAAFLPVS